MLLILMIPIGLRLMQEKDVRSQMVYFQKNQRKLLAFSDINQLNMKQHKITLFESQINSK